MAELRTIPGSLDDILAAIAERDRRTTLMPAGVVKWDTALAAEVRRLRAMLEEREAQLSTDMGFPISGEARNA